MVWVVESKLIEDYKVYIKFNDGVCGTIDFYNKILNDHRPLVRELIKMEVFKTVKTEMDTICWDNGVDFAPEYMYKQIKIQQKAA